MKKGYIGVATNRALSVAHCAQKKKKKKKKKKKLKLSSSREKCFQGKNYTMYGLGVAQPLKYPGFAD